jgi:hypothetical protein
MITLKERLDLKFNPESQQVDEMLLTLGAIALFSLAATPILNSEFAKLVGEGVKNVLSGFGALGHSIGGLFSAFMASNKKKEDGDNKDGESKDEGDPDSKTLSGDNHKKCFEMASTIMAITKTHDLDLSKPEDCEKAKETYKQVSGNDIDDDMKATGISFPKDTMELNNTIEAAKNHMNSIKNDETAQEAMKEQSSKLDEAASEISKRVEADKKVTDLEEKLKDAEGDEKAKLEKDLDEAKKAFEATKKPSEVADAKDGEKKKEPKPVTTKDKNGKTVKLKRMPKERGEGTKVVRVGDPEHQSLGKAGEEMMRNAKKNESIVNYLCSKLNF